MAAAASYIETKKEKKSSKKRNRIIAEVISQIVLIILSIMALFPFIWMVTSSLKSNAEIFQYPPKLLPEVPRWKNYVDAVVSVNFGRGFLNSIKLTLINTLVRYLPHPWLDTLSES